MTALSIDFAADCAAAAPDSLGRTRSILAGLTVQEEGPATLYSPEIRNDNGFGPSAGEADGLGGGQCYAFGGGTSTAASSTMGFVAVGKGTRKHEALIVFRGSELNSNATKRAAARDILMDVSFAFGRSPKGFEVHGGFATVFESCRPQIEEIFLHKLPKNITTVHCVGHSMGGALATLAAEYFIDYPRIFGQAPLTPYLYTFGAPRVGMSKHVNYMNDKMGDRIFRYYYSNDLVTWLPMYPFCHLPGQQLKTDLSGMQIHTAYFTRAYQFPAVQEVNSPMADAESFNTLARNELQLRGGTCKAIGYIVEGFKNIMRLAGFGIGLACSSVLLLGGTALDQLAAFLAYAISQGRREKPLIMEWISNICCLIGFGASWFPKKMKGGAVGIISFLLNKLNIKVKASARSQLNYADQHVRHQGHQAGQVILRFH